MRRAFLMGPRFGFNHLKEMRACERCVFGRGAHTCEAAPIAETGDTVRTADRDDSRGIGWQVEATLAAALPCRVGWREQREFDAIARLLGPLRVTCMDIHPPDAPDSWIGPTYSIFPVSDCRDFGSHDSPCTCVAIAYEDKHDPGRFYSQGLGTGPRLTIDETITAFYDTVILLRGGELIRARPGCQMVYGPMNAAKWKQVERVERIPASWGWNYNRVPR